MIQIKYWWEATLWDFEIFEIFLIKRFYFQKKSYIHKKRYQHIVPTYRWIQIWRPTCNWKSRSNDIDKNVPTVLKHNKNFDYFRGIAFQTAIWSSYLNSTICTIFSSIWLLFFGEKRAVSKRGMAEIRKIFI